MSEQRDGPLRIIYIHNPSRSHKILPLLSDYRVVSVAGPMGLIHQRMKESLRTTEPTMVLADNFGRWILLAILASLLWRAPLIFRLRGEFFREELERTRHRSEPLRWLTYTVNASLARLGLWRSQLILCNSEYLARAMRPHTKAKPVAVVRNPYTAPSGQSTKTPLPKASLRLLTVTNANLWSKIQPTLEAIDSWISPEPLEELDAHWIICGTGRHLPQLRRAVQNRGLESRVHCLGRAENVPDLYEWSDVLVHLTRLDAFPNAPMEAMVAGSPVITNVDSCGTREQVFDGVNGRVVSDTHSFVAAVRMYAENESLRHQHADYGRRFVESEFSVDVQRRNLENALSRFRFEDKGRRWKYYT